LVDNLNKTIEDTEYSFSKIKEVLAQSWVKNEEKIRDRGLSSAY